MADRSATEVRAALARQPLTVVGRLVSASNATLLCTLELHGLETRCVYKPVAGERPLWDFPTATLARREVATGVLAAAFGLALVPPTVWRDGGPFGAGMCQLWIEDAEGGADVDVVPPDEIPPGWLVSVTGMDGGHREVAVVHADRPELRELALFDIVVNNADRKGGHIMRSPDGVLHAIDHGVTFHVEDKLRSVLWGWAGIELTVPEIARLESIGEQLRGELAEQLGEWLAGAEIKAVRRRIRNLVRDGRFPSPSGEWPSVPWPVF